MKTPQIKQPVLLVVLLSIGITTAYGDDDDHDANKTATTTLNRTTVGYSAYKEECGSCHLAYPPGLLPTDAWLGIMSTLNAHFGDNAEMTAAKQHEVRQFLQHNSKSERHSRQTLDATHSRITQQAAFLHHHSEIPARLSTANPAVKNFSNCAACHQRAEQGSFAEREIRIPGYGRWED